VGLQGPPGFRDLSGLVLIDGGLLGTVAPPKLGGREAAVAALRTGDPFLDLLGIGVPWAAGVFSDLAGLYAKVRPDARATFVDYPAIPAALKPPGPGHQRGRARLRVRRVHLPRRAVADPRARGRRSRPSGDPRPWQNGEVTPIENVAKLFGRSPVDAAEWYFPKRPLARRAGRGPAEPQRGGELPAPQVVAQARIDVPALRDPRRASRAGACCAGRGGWWRGRGSRRGR
jgi:hypothetical protein